VSLTSWQQVGNKCDCVMHLCPICNRRTRNVLDDDDDDVMEFGMRHDTTDTTDFWPRQLVRDLLRICYGETTGKPV